MTDKINTLKALIEALDAESPLRKSLEEALAAEKKRMADEEASRCSAQAAAEEQNDDEEEDGKGDSSFSNVLDGITDKLDDLLENDEFVAASAGFLLGAVTVGAGALAVSALKK